MDRFALTGIVVFFFVLALSYAVLHVRRRKKGSEETAKDRGFRPRIGFTRLDGMASLALLLANGSDTYVWAEEIEICLSDLIANQQTAEATCRATQKIRQMVPPRDMLPISLSEVVYKAAGDPQRRYSCVLSSVLRYRIGKEQFEKNLENYRIRMIGLTASGADRERKAIRPVATESKSREGAEIALKK